MNTELKITPPQGYEIDRENSTLELIKFKKIEEELPKSWERAVKNETTDRWLIDHNSYIYKVNVSDRMKKTYRNSFHTKEQAEAMLAFIQLIWLRDIYNDGWEPDWEDVSENKYVIYTYKLVVQIGVFSQNVLAFKTLELAEEFLHNFRGLIEKAKMFI